LVRKLMITAEAGDRFSSQEQQQLVRFLGGYGGRYLRFCCTCGAHLRLAYVSGLRAALSPQLDVAAGPGNAAAITPTSYIDRLLKLAEKNDTLVLADAEISSMPGSSGMTLAQACSAGARVENFAVPSQALARAAELKDTKVVAAAVGFEPAAVAWALTARQAITEGVNNLKLLTGLKKMPELIGAVSEADVLDGFVVPGHVAMLMGAKYFRHTAHIYHEPMVIAGYTREQMLLALCKLCYRAERLYAGVYNLYPEFVSEEGNPRARELLSKSYAGTAAYARGLGVVKDAGLLLTGELSALDAGSEGCELYEDALASSDAAAMLRGEKLLEESADFTNEAANALDWTVFIK